MDITAQRLGEPLWQDSDVKSLLADCFEHESALGLWLLDDGRVRLSTEPPTAAGVTLTGTWRSPALARPPKGTGAMLLLPLVMMVRALVLPRKCLYSLGRGDQSLADVLLRNFFYAVTRGEPVRILQADQTLPDAAEQCSRDLARHYVRLMQSQLQDPVFHRPNAAELILANAHLRLFTHSSALLERGAQEWRHAVAEQGTGHTLAVRQPQGRPRRAPGVAGHS
jgi:hypothetical protein